MEDIQEEDFINEEVDNTSEALKAIRKRKEAFRLEKRYRIE